MVFQISVRVIGNDSGLKGLIKPALKGPIEARLRARNFVDVWAGAAMKKGGRELLQNLRGAKV